MQVTHPNSEQQRVDGFATVSDAARWISEQTQDWLRVGVLIVLSWCREKLRLSPWRQNGIGIDFDNTIVTYDEVFCAMAKRCGLIDPAFVGSKQAVRDAIRLLPDGELAWQRLQGQVYSKGLADANMVRGFEAFLRRCRAEGCAVMIVSHKTEFGHYDPDRINLREAALTG